MAQYITIIDYDENSFDVKILSEKQREWFYKRVMDYEDEIESNNYYVDKQNNLYKYHNKGYERNKYIIERLVKET